MQAPRRPRGEAPNVEPESAAGAPRSAIRPHAPGEDTAFMEEILRELSEQNEQARSNGGLRRGLRDAARGVKSDPPGAASSQTPGTVHVARDGAFRTPVGTASVQAYLPARTVAPKPSAPVEAVTVKVTDPRRIPTVRVPRTRGARGAAKGDPIAGDESVPTLRSSAGAAAARNEPPASEPRPRRLLWLALAALVTIAAAVAATVMVRSWW